MRREVDKKWLLLQIGLLLSSFLASETINRVAPEMLNPGSLPASLLLLLNSLSLEAVRLSDLSSLFLA